MQESILDYRLGLVAFPLLTLGQTTANQTKVKVRRIGKKHPNKLAEKLSLELMDHLQKSLKEKSNLKASFLVIVAVNHGNKG